MNIKEYKKLAFIPSISSYEKNVVDFLLKELKDNNFNQFYKDNIGSLVVKKPTKKDELNLMFASHIDEVGFMVEDIVGDYLKLKPVGSLRSHLVLGQIYSLINKNKEIFHGVISSPASHGLKKDAREKTLPIDQIYLDLAIKGEDYSKYDIEVGDQVVPYSPDISLANENYFMTKAVDNRISAYVGMEIMRNDLNNKSNLWWAYTVQEEPGLRGARTTTELIKPDVAFAIDTTLAEDTIFNKGNIKLGGGVVLSYIDSNSIAHRGLMRWVEEICKNNNIKYQYAVFNKGGTDSGNIHKMLKGVVNITLSIPVRYMHSSNTIANKFDVDQTISLVRAIVEELDNENYRKIVL